MFSIFLSTVLIFLTFYIMSEVVDKYFIKSLDNIASYLKIPDDVAGATLMAFGTSAPEIFTAFLSLFLLTGSAASGVGVGTIVGSAIFQILVVIGFAAIIAPAKLTWKPVLRDSFFYLISILLLILVVNDNVITVYEAGVLVSFYFVYLIVLFFWSKNSDPEKPINKDNTEPLEVETEQSLNSNNFLIKIFTLLVKPINLVLNLIPDCQKKPKTTFFVFFLSLSIIGAVSYVMVLSAEQLANDLGIDPAIVALTILAGGSSIPEMISSAVVAKQGRSDMAIANAIGSNIFDVLVSLGLPVLVWTMLNGDLTEVGAGNINSSLILLFATLFAVVLILISQKFNASRYFGGGLIFLYFIYVWMVYSGFLESFSF